MNILGVDPKDVIIEDMKRTLRDIERTLRNAGTPMAVWHNSRDQQLASEFIKLANHARESLDFVESLT